MTDHHLSRRDADRILDAPAESGRPVAEVLEALRAPVTADELRREDSAVTAFRVARLAPSPRSRRGMSPTTPRTAAVRALTATGLVVALTSGGFALAATGHLPALPDQASDTATDAVARHSTSPSQSPSETVTEDATTSDEATDDLEATQGAPGESTEATESTDDAESTEDAETSDETTAAPTPSLEGLCKAFQASDKGAHGKSLDNPAFTALATAAGSKDGIATYCVTLVGEPAATGKPTALPTQAATGKPTVRPTPTAKPTTRPTPASPTGKPSTAPSPAGQGKPSGTGKPAGAGKPQGPGNH